MASPVVLIAALEAAINQYLKLDPSTSQRLAILEGQVIAVELRGLGLRFYLLPGPGGMQILSYYAGDPDTWLIGTPLGLAQLASGSGGSGRLFSGDVEIRGDVSLGEQFREIMDDMQIDWEEILSHVVGDFAARKLGNAAHETAAWARSSAETLALNLTEYLHEEGRLLPYREQVEEFMSAVDTLRSDVDRLEARIRRLEPFG
jgi:ubiquinone biosynthesis protein UbiJ